jgi:hypothetical protein
MLLGAMLCSAGHAEKVEYPLTVHVTSSGYLFMGQVSNQELDVTLDGKRFQLLESQGYGLLAPGDYKARIVKDSDGNNYEMKREYELLLPDGKTRKVSVWRRYE